MTLLAYFLVVCGFIACLKGGVIAYANFMLLKDIHNTASRSRRNNIPVSYQNNATIIFLLLSLTFFVSLLPLLICLAILGYDLSVKESLGY